MHSQRFTLIGLFALSFISSAFGACYLSAPTVNVTLSFCTEYSGDACCSTTQDLGLEASFLSLGAEFGSGNCAANIKTLLCAVGCSPNQAAYGAVTIIPAPSIVFTVNTSFSNGMYASCENVCIAGVSLSQVYPSGTALLGAFGTSNIKGYVPSLNNPGIAFTSGSNNAGFTHSVLPPSGGDQVSCSCPLGGGMSPSPQDLTFCTQYSGEACCTPSQDAAAQARFNNITAAFGNGGCTANLKSVLCALTCSPLQSNLTEYITGAQNFLSFAVSPDFADAVYDVCRNNCVGAYSTLGSRFPTPAALIQFLNVTNGTPLFNGTAAQAQINFAVENTSASGSVSFNTSVIPATSVDNAPCLTLTTSSVSNNAMFVKAISFVSVVAMFFAY